jgi:glycosyltransferase involved in cell wall biosynthesis
MKFQESALAHKLLDGLEGIEIGGSAHNQWGLRTRNVDYTADMNTAFKIEEVKVCGEALPVDIVSPGDNLPLEDSSVDFVISSHVIEHFPDPIKALKEWHRVVRPGGYLFVVAPHKERTFDKDRERSTLAELKERHRTGIGPDPDAAHCSVWITADFVELIDYLGWPIVEVLDTDDKVGNGFTVVMRVEKNGEAPAIRATKRDRLSMTFLMGPTGNTRTGGAACILEYARRLRERGHQVSLTTWPRFLWLGESPFPGLDFDIPIHYDIAAKTSALPLHFLNQSPRDYLGELRFFLAYLSLLTPAIPKADLLIASNWEAIIPAWQSGRGKPVHFPQHYDEVFFTLDGSSNSLQANPLIKMLCRSAFQMPTYRIANSTWLAGEMRRRFGDEVPVVNHGIDVARFHPMPKRSAQDGIFRVVTYSRPEKWKGFQDAVPAMAELMARHPGKIEWHVYGFPHAIGAENPLAPYKFHGALAHDELSRLYAESDIVLCPSWYESFPLPPIEAMACGTAVVTTSYGTEDYAVDGETAMVVRPRVVEDFVAALDVVVLNPELRGRLARKGREMAESLTWDRAVSAREELLWRIHRNQMPNHALRGFDTGITDGFGNSFERLIAEAGATDGELLIGADGKHYVVDSSRLRRVSDPAGIGFDPSQARTVDQLTLIRNEQGPDITARANYFGLHA